MLTLLDGCDEAVDSVWGNPLVFNGKNLEDDVYIPPHRWVECEMQVLRNNGTGLIICLDKDENHNSCICENRFFFFFLIK